MHAFVLLVVALALVKVAAPGDATLLARTAESALTPCPRNPDRHNGFMKRIAQGPVGLLFLGDSIMDAWPSASPATWARFEPYQVADFAVSGERTEDVLWRISQGELDGIDPLAVVIMIGTNNIGHFPDERPEWAAAGILAIVRTVRSTLPKAKILLLGVFPRGATGSDGLRLKTVAINRIISGSADGSNVVFLDVASRFLDTHGNLPTEIFPDLLHPNAKGYQIWADAMWPVLGPLLQR